MQQIDALYTALRDELSGALALDTTTAIARFNRITGSSDFAAAVELLAAQLRRAKLDRVNIERFPIDGEQCYMGRVLVPAYEPHSARLRGVSPRSPTLCCASKQRASKSNPPAS